MSRITVEDCLGHVTNRFELVMLASKRARQLFKGAKPLIDSDKPRGCCCLARDRRHQSPEKIVGFLI